MQDPEKFKSRMQSLAYGNAMMAAVRDYKEVRTCQTWFTRAPNIYRVEALLTWPAAI